MSRVLIFATLLAAACQTGPQHSQRPLAVLANEADSPTPAAAARESSADEAAFEFFYEDIEIDADEYLQGGALELGEGLVLLGSSSPPRGLLDLATMEVVELPAFAGNPDGRPSFKSAVEHGLIIASWEERKEQVVRLQVLRLSSMRWEQAGRFDIPKSRALHKEEKRFGSVWLHMFEGELRLELTDEVEIQSSYVLDLETLVWGKVANRSLDHGPCLMSSKVDDDDRVRWGIGKSRDDSGTGGPCVAVRATLDDDWKRIEDASDELIFMRSIRPIDERRFLVTGGFGFRLSPFVSRADVVDVVDAEIRSLGKQVVGKSVDVPGEPFLWVSKDSVVRFDPATESFERSPGPNLGFQPSWWFSIDDRTMLFAGRDKQKQARYVIAGFRPAK